MLTKMFEEYTNINSEDDERLPIATTFLEKYEAFEGKFIQN